ncbi:hypothetical protein [Blastopirellula marina]|uniref:Uncharacterized protein n=1 Tax=Blastopirellula marina TaxID=124 RepID=A0A2S8GLY9_9BACT|nr:hypothetical protein [Blastopirellula marina]PQO45448.1 hypothetical protein C5Y93_13435 [Blastopirellula marina]
MKERIHVEEFENAFVMPYVSHAWASRTGRSHWVELEFLQDCIAGPLQAIAKTGGCPFVYDRIDWYYSEVTEPASLKLQLLQWHSQLINGVRQFKPNSLNEQIDLQFMMECCETIGMLIDRGCSIEQLRFEQSQPH